MKTSCARLLGRVPDHEKSHPRYRGIPDALCPRVCHGPQYPSGKPENFIGVSELVIDLGENEIMATLAFVISTRGDTNLFEMSRLVNLLVNTLMVGSQIRVYDATAGTPKGHLISHEKVRVGAVLNTETQPARPVFVNLLSDMMLMRN